MPARIATRNGKPAWEDAPEPKRAPVPMRDWLKRHTSASQDTPTCQK